MARPFNITVKETVQELEKRLKTSTIAKNKERLFLLYWLKIGRVKSRKEIAQLLSTNESTVGRWLKKYKNGGISELLEVKQAPGKPSVIPADILERLKERLKQPQGFGSYGEIKTWLKDNYNIEIAYKTVHKIVKYKLQAKLKIPRPHSLKREETALEHFKKTFLPD